MDFGKYLTEGFNVFELKLTFYDDNEFPSIVVIDIYRTIPLIKGFENEIKIIDTNPNLFVMDDGLDIDKIKSFTFFIASKKSFSETEKILTGKLKAYNELKSYLLKEYKTKTEIHSKQDDFVNAELLNFNPDNSDNKILNKKKSGLNKRKSGSIRIDLEKIEELGNLVGELLTSKIQLDSLLAKMIKINNSDNIFENTFIGEIKNTNKQLSSSTEKLRDLSLSIRMIPLAGIFNKFPRVVRDLAKEKQKKIELLIEGQDTELDKTIIEEIADPIMHLIRNSIDHGIEEQNIRAAKQKPETAKIFLRAFNEANNIVIEVEDDGKGLDLEKIKQKALDKNLISREKLDTLSDSAIYNFIFRPGFSTADKITEISGRGVGLDVVKSNIEKLNGIIEINSNKDKGTKFTLKLPLTLSIMPVLLVKENEQTFGIPLFSILSVSNADKFVPRRLGSYKIIEKDKHIIPVFKLADIFNLNFKDNRSEYLLEIAVAEKRFGLYIDSIIGQQEIVIKPLGNYLGNVKGVSGGTILGDGRVSLIMDAKGMVTIIEERTGEVL